MRSSALTFLFALVAPLSLGSIACFLSTADDGYDYDTYGTGGGGECSASNVGSEGCPCTSGGECNAPFFCIPNQNICAADPCPVGTETCACTPKGACDMPLTCASEICVNAGCLTMAGTEGCQCTDGGGCDPNLSCLSGLCVDPNSGQDSGVADETGTPPGSTGMADETGTPGTTGGSSSDGASSGSSSSTG